MIHYLLAAAVVSLGLIAGHLWILVAELQRRVKRLEESADGVAEATRERKD